jgi:tRNA1Val (adenine37-N6)-methyltransferase
MKVTTDASLFGAWNAVNFPIETNNNRVLDIGAGTGLLSLMYAQKNPSAIIDAVEIDDDAAAQATENFETSPWKERLNLFHTGIDEFYSSHKYDLIITNPPFFENDLKGINDKKNLALHSISLTLDELIQNITRLLTEDGAFNILLPGHRADYFKKLAAAQSWHCIEEVLVKQSEKHHHFRNMLCFSKKQPAAKTATELTIKIGGEYSPEFIQLLQPFYLYL